MVSMNNVCSDPLDIVVFENEECTLDGEKAKELLIRVHDKLEEHLNRENDELRYDEEKDTKESRFRFDEEARKLQIWNMAGVVIDRELKLWVVPKILKPDKLEKLEKLEELEKLKSSTLLLLYHMVSYVKGYWRISKAL
ncbi:MAG: hypothetical protein QW309_07760, partial [Zestosphaera sp.]